MSFGEGVRVSSPLSVVHGAPLADEDGIGALTIPGYLGEVAERFAGQEAVVFHEGGARISWSYADLAEEARKVARALIAGGVSRDSRVGILMTNRPEFLAAAFGTALAGGVFVPLNTFATADELRHLVQTSGISVLLFERQVAGKDYAAMLAELAPEMAGAQPGELACPTFPFLRRLVMVGEGAVGGAIEGWAGFLSGGARVSPEVIEASAAAVQPSDTAAIFFSSGTTSTPKGIVHSHRAIALQWWRWPWMYTDGGEVRMWCANGFFWSGPFSLVIGCSFTTGGALVLQSTFDAADALRLMVEERITVPLARRHQWARIEELPEWAGAPLGHLRCFDPVRMLHHPHPAIATTYREPRAFGTTETLTNVAIFPPNVPQDIMGKGMGPPLPGNVIRIVDPLTGAVVPVGQTGELALKGPTMMLGYLGKTLDETFDEEGFYRTGDSAWVDEAGVLYWDGRLTDMIKTGGANVAPEEVDRAILLFPGVKLSQTVGVPDELLSERVVSCIVPQDGAVIDEAALRSFLKGKLASYKLPRDILIFAESEMSLTGSGAKIKAGDMRARAIARLAGGG